MKSILRRSLAALLALFTVLTMCAVSITSVVAAVVEDDNKPCDCGAEVATEVVAPTCAENGYTWNTCSECGKTWATDLVAATGDHDYVDRTEPTCTEPGYIGCKVCSVCGDVDGEGEEIPAYNHIYPEGHEKEGQSAYIQVGSTEADCNTPGTKTMECQLCGDEKTEPTGGDGHKHELNEIDYQAPTCVANGYTLYECTECDDEFKVIYKALGHVLNTEKIDATCDEEGYEIGGYCSRPVVDKQGHPTGDICGCVDEELVIKPYHHEGTYEDSGEPFSKPLTGAEDGEDDGKYMFGGQLIDVRSEGNCTEGTDGYELQHCSKCDTDWKKTWEPKHDYQPSEGEGKYQASGCAEGTEGYQWKTCTICGDEKKFELPLAPHQYTTGNAAASALVWTFKLTDGTYYTVNGAIIYTQVDPGTTLPEGCPEDAVIVKWVIQLEPSCGVMGIFVHSCSVCGHVEKLEIKSAHVNPEAVGGEHAATCDEAAYTIYQCKNDNCEAELDGNKGQYKVYNNAKPALGHLHAVDGKKDTYERKPDLFRPGSTTEHMPDLIEGKKPTCTEWGQLDIEVCYDENCALFANVGKDPVDNTAEPTGHDWINTVEVTVQPNCAHRGFVVDACGACGKVVRNPNATPGSSEEAIPVDSLEAYNLRKADSEFGEVDLTAHEWDKIYTPGYDAECGANGREDVVECTVCHKLKGGDYIEPLKKEIQTLEVEPTCLHNGYKVTYCENCYDIENFDEATFDLTAYLANPETYGPAYFGTTYHGVTVAPTGKIAANEGHIIAGAVYTPMTSTDPMYNLVDEKDRFRVDVTGATPVDNKGGVTNEGSCGSGLISYHTGWYTCENCGEPFEFSVIKEHTIDSTWVDEGNCTIDCVCLVCDELLVDKKGHTYEMTFTDADCWANGVEEYNCSVCGDYYAVEFYGDDDREIPEGKEEGDPIWPALDHEWNIEAPTCTEDKVCELCGETEEALNHIYPAGHEKAGEEAWELVEAHQQTCQNGYWEEQECALCGDTRNTEEGEIGSHTAELFDERTADCLLFGFKNYVCSGCGEYYEFDENEFVASKGHTIHEVEATCTEHGYTFCTTCNGSVADGPISTEADENDPDWKGQYQYAVTDEALKHVKDDVRYEEKCTDIADLVDEDGNVTCDECNKTINIDDVHNLSAPIDTATCHKDGFKFKYCLNGCGERVMLETTFKREHSFKLDTNDDEYKAPTYMEAGLDVFVCEYCKNEEAECVEGVCRYTVVTEALNGLKFTATIDNAIKSGELIVNGGVVAYTISIEAANASFWSIQIPVSFDTDAFTYLGLDKEGTNIFGSTANLTTTDAAIANGLGCVYVYGTNATEEDVSLADKQEFVTLYFRVNSDLYAEAAAYAAIEAAITFGNTEAEEEIVVLDAKKEDVHSEDEDCDVAEIWMLGDVDDNGLVNGIDDKTIVDMIAAEEYDARADIDQNGAVDFFDLIFIKQYIVKNFTYAELCSWVENFEC